MVTMMMAKMTRMNPMTRVEVKVDHILRLHKYQPLLHQMDQLPYSENLETNQKRERERESVVWCGVCQSKYLIHIYRQP